MGIGGIHKHKKIMPPREIIDDIGKMGKCLYKEIIDNIVSKYK